MTCPCSLFGSTVPVTPAVTDTSDLSLGVRVVPKADGVITGIRFYKGSGNTGTHTGTLWSATGALLSTGTFTNETTTGWQTLKFTRPVPVTAGTTYVASYRAPVGRYAAVPNFFYPSAVVAGPLSAPRNNGSVENGLYAAGAGFPTNSYQATNYYVDVTWATTDSVGPSVVSRTPTPGAASLDGVPSPAAVFDIPVQPSSVVMTVKASGGPVPGTVAYDSATQTATFTPTSPFADGKTFTVSVSGAKNSAGTPMPAANVWSFSTAQAGACPCSLFTGADVPDVVDSGDGSSIEVGVRLTPTAPGKITGIRFYKSQANTGTHTATLRSAAGAVLATGTFAEESATGWQTMSFATPVQVAAGTTYVASYYAPTGHYSKSSDFFTTDYSRGELTAAATGGNGVYAYRSGGGNPTSTYRATNYWVDVTWEADPSLAAPSVTTVTPADGGEFLPVSTNVTAKFNVAVKPASIVMTVKGPGGAAVPGRTSYDSSSRTVTFTPSSSLAAGTKYDAAVTQATSLFNIAITAPATWSFTTDGPSPGLCPCTLLGTTVPVDLDSGDTSAIEVGVKFTPTSDGKISAIRFYKATGNTGTHVGSLWAADGTRLAKVTFASETASGWQTMALAVPVSVTAGTTYVASYYAPVGHYSRSSDYFTSARTSGPLTAPSGSNGVYRFGAGGGFPTSSYRSTSYSVDVVLRSSALPQVTSTAPAAGATGVSPTTHLSATFATPVTSGTASWTLTASDGTVVPGGTSYDAAGSTSWFDPATALAASMTYRATLSGAKTTAGVPMVNPVTFTFTTSAAGQCPCDLMTAAGVPEVVDTGDVSAIEVGTRFTPSVNGQVTGVRFYKAAANTGTHKGTLWSTSGTALATGIFTSESGSGWQTLTFASPVAVTAGTEYVVSYFAPNGHYSKTAGFFASDYVNGPLSAPSGANGVYAYGNGGVLPTGSYQSSNYWVDVVFQTS